MTSGTEFLIEQIDALLSRAELAPGQYVDWRHFENFTDAERVALGTAWTAGIERMTAPGSKYREIMTTTIQRFRGAGETVNLAETVGILNAIRNDLEAGYMTQLVELIHGDVFADFLEMADELHGKGYKDAAAVIAGSVLEEHLRKLCEKTGVPVSSSGSPRKADTLNADLVKAGAYNKLEQKSVTAWLGLRNDAAHGHYDNYDSAQVALMIEGVRGFLVRHPA